MTAPLTPAELARVKVRADQLLRCEDVRGDEIAGRIGMTAGHDVPRLVAEVERLRSEIERRDRRFDS